MQIPTVIQITKKHGYQRWNFSVGEKPTDFFIEFQQKRFSPLEYTSDGILYYYQWTILLVIVSVKNSFGKYSYMLVTEF